MNHWTKQKTVFTIALVVLGALLAFLYWIPSSTTAAKKGELPEGRLLPPRSHDGQVIQAQVSTGNVEAAKAYYNKITERLKFPLATTINAPPGTIFNPDFTLQTVLDWAGYGGVLASDLERLSSFEINDPTVLASKISNPAAFQAHFSAVPIAPQDIVATRYFSPKITDVSGLTPGDELAYGFRKVVRLKTRADSTAAKVEVGIDAVWVLFNYFVKAGDLAKVPLEQGSSVNIQIMATRPWPSTVAGAQPSYWMVFDQAKAGKHSLIGHLNATFDARDAGVVEKSPNPVKKYYVPNACAQCHGSKETTAKLNFLDTDHWFQRVAAASPLPGNDFPKYAGSPHGVLVEGGKNESAPAFKQAFSDVRFLNQEIEKQNASVDAGFQTLAVRKWLEQHATSDAFIPPAQRGFGGEAEKWKADNADDKQTIELLDRYCYRCHSSVKFNVYDKAAVSKPETKTDILSNLDTGRMPQDRLLTKAEIARLKSLIEKLP